MRGRGGWKSVLQKCGGPCVIIVGTPMMLVWCAGSLDLKWMYQGDVSLFFLCLFWLKTCTLQMKTCMGASNVVHTVLA